MGTYTYVHTRIFIHTCIYIYIYVYLYIYIHIHTYIHTCFISCFSSAPAWTIRDLAHNVNSRQLHRQRVVLHSLPQWISIFLLSKAADEGCFFCNFQFLNLPGPLCEILVLPGRPGKKTEKPGKKKNGKKTRKTTENKRAHKMREGRRFCENARRNPKKN